MSTKVHLAVTDKGCIVEGFLSGGQESDVKHAPTVINDVVGCYILADKGYDSDEFRAFIAGNNNIAVIPGKINRKEEIVYDKKRYKKRSIIERLFGNAKEHRRLALRFEKTDLSFISFFMLAFIKLFLKRLC